MLSLIEGNNMLRHIVVMLLVGSFVFTASPTRARVMHVAELRTAGIRARDHTKTVVLLHGGILEEHGKKLSA